jgi:hypothetical protein
MNYILSPGVGQDVSYARRFPKLLFGTFDPNGNEGLRVHQMMDASITASTPRLTRFELVFLWPQIQIVPILRSI